MSLRIAHNTEKKWRSKDIKTHNNEEFSSLQLSEKVLSGLRECGFKHPSPIQLASIPLGRLGKDMIVQAKSGTGKTLVFSVIALEMLSEVEQPQVIILCATRELAIQTSAVIQAIGCEFEDLYCETFVGGLPMKDARDCQIVVGTPGRIGRLIDLQMLPTDSIRLVILDEIDDLLHSDLICDFRSIFQSLPEDKQVIATSTTFSSERELLQKFFKDPILTCLNMRDPALLGMIHYIHIIAMNKIVSSYILKLKILQKILKKAKFRQCIVFCNGLTSVTCLHSDIEELGISTTYISSALEQFERIRVIDDFRSRKYKVLISTDVISHGIDLKNVDLVVNFDVPKYRDLYIHRVGRGGRYGSKCACITFLQMYEIDTFQSIEEEGNFQSYLLPDPVPKKLINLRPDEMKRFELDASDESSSSSESSSDSMCIESKSDEEMENDYDRCDTEDDLNDTEGGVSNENPGLLRSDPTLNENNLQEEANSSSKQSPTSKSKSSPFIYYPLYSFNKFYTALKSIGRIYPKRHYSESSSDDSSSDESSVIDKYKGLFKHWKERRNKKPVQECPCFGPRLTSNCCVHCRHSSCQKYPSVEQPSSCYRVRHPEKKSKSSRKHSRGRKKSETSQGQYAYPPQTSHHDNSKSARPFCMNHPNQGNMADTHLNFHQTQPTYFQNPYLPPFQHPCARCNVHCCQSRPYKTWNDIFYEQWQFINQYSHFK